MTRSLAVVIASMPVADSSTNARYSGPSRALALDVADGEQEPERGGGHDHSAEEHAEPVHAHHAAIVVTARRSWTSCHWRRAAPAAATAANARQRHVVTGSRAGAERRAARSRPRRAERELGRDREPVDRRRLDRRACARSHRPATPVSRRRRIAAFATPGSW
jgi:hypothetical protein